MKDISIYCCYCGKPFSIFLKITSDHLIPLSKGGVNNDYNKRNCCQFCNASKGAYYPEQYLQQLIRKRNRLAKRKIFGTDTATKLYDTDIAIENVKHIVEYVQSAGEKLFVNKFFHENYIDRRSAIDERIIA